jgi:hypothetical protein
MNASQRKGTRRMRRSPIQLEQHANTFHGLHHWYEHILEKLGWMVLAKAKGYDYKIPVYKKSIEHLIASIKNVMSEYTDSDKIHDLHVLLMNTLVLHDFVSKTL